MEVFIIYSPQVELIFLVGLAFLCIGRTIRESHHFRNTSTPIFFETVCPAISRGAYGATWWESPSFFDLLQGELLVVFDQL